MWLKSALSLAERSCRTGLDVFWSRLRGLGKETEEAAVFRSHPQLLVPEQQFAAGLVQLQPVDLGVVADGSQVEASSQIHWSATEAVDSELKIQTTIPQIRLLLISKVS